jgi:CRP-like cAMP-binding protein
MQQATFPEDLGRELRKVGLFRTLGDAQIARLCRIARVERYKQGEFLFHHGDPSDRFYVVLEGKIRIGRNIEGLGEEALAILGPGSHFGELCIIDDEPRSADAVIHEEAVLLVVDRTAIEDLMLVDKALGYELLWTIARTLAARLRETDDKIILLAGCSKFG